MSYINEILTNIGLRKIGILLLVTTLLVPSSLMNSYAEGDNEIGWKMLVVGSTVCDTHHRVLLETYSALVTEYLNLYELSNTQKSSDCISEKEYLELEDKNDSDLLIVIFDELLAKKTMRSNVFDGFYLHTGNDRSQNHMIVMCHCSNFESGYERKYTSWILSHELSHFVLSWQGYDYAAVERLVHVLEDSYESCSSIEVTDCKDEVFLSPPSLTQSYAVFPPIEMAKGSDSMQSVDKEASNNEMVLGFYKQVTNWWLDDMISSDAYLNATKQVFFSPLSLYSGLTIETGMELSNGVIILDHAKEKPLTWKQVTYQKELPVEDEIKILLNYVPDYLLDAKNEPIPFGEIPQYFKQRAQYWVDGKISDEKFFDSIDRLIRTNVIPLQ